MKQYVFSLAGVYTWQFVACLVCALAAYPHKLAATLVACALACAFIAVVCALLDWHDRHD